ncbi:hypothetical protein ACFL57_04085 [Candidatus Margulisiibacteriota bacterium]
MFKKVIQIFHANIQQENESDHHREKLLTTEELKEIRDRLQEIVNENRLSYQDLIKSVSQYLKGKIDLGIFLLKEKENDGELQIKYLRRSSEEGKPIEEINSDVIEWQKADQAIIDVKQDGFWVGIHQYELIKDIKEVSQRAEAVIQGIRNAGMYDQLKDSSEMKMLNYLANLKKDQVRKFSDICKDGKREAGLGKDTINIANYTALSLQSMMDIACKMLGEKIFNNPWNTHIQGPIDSLGKYLEIVMKKNAEHIRHYFGHEIVASDLEKDDDDDDDMMALTVRYSYSNIVLIFDFIVTNGIEDRLTAKNISTELDKILLEKFPEDHREVLQDIADILLDAISVGIDREPANKIKRQISYSYLLSKGKITKEDIVSELKQELLKEKVLVPDAFYWNKMETKLNLKKINETEAKAIIDSFEADTDLIKEAMQAIQQELSTGVNEENNEDRVKIQKYHFPVKGDRTLVRDAYYLKEVSPSVRSGLVGQKTGNLETINNNIYELPLVLGQKE